MKTMRALLGGIFAFAAVFLLSACFQAEQVINVSQTTVVREAWARGQEVAVHGWIYGLHDGLLRDLGVQVTATERPGRDEAVRR